VIDWVIWVAAGLILLIMEVVLPGVFMMWLGLAAAVALGIGLRLRRPRQVIHTEREGLIGRPVTALVFQGRDGRVRLGDSDWAARVPLDITPPDPGARLRVAQVDGTILIVRPDL
jgi:inner membrane protein